MFRFANIEFLWLLLLIPILVVAHVLYNRYKKKQLAVFGEEQLLNDLMPNRSTIRPHIKFGLEIAALCLLILALARPQFGTNEQTIKRQGIEVMVALDVSNSMMAEDVAPCRLDKAKQMLAKLVDNMHDDKFGLVVFAGEAYTQLPITCDYVSAKMFMHSITPDLIPTQGTAIGEAIETAIRSFGSEESEASRAIILITDGENHEDDAVEVAKKAKGMGIKVLVVGIGKPSGSPIPVPGTSAFRKDRSGNVVISKLNEDMCKEIAAAGGGIYVRADNSNTTFKALNKEIETLDKSEIETKVYAEYNEQYQSFVLIALLLLIADFFVFNRKNKRLSKFSIFDLTPIKKATKMKQLFAILLMLILCLPAFSQQESADVRRGNRDYKKEKYIDAEIDYRKGLDKNNNSFEGHFNLGNSLFKQEKYADALEEYQKANSLLDGTDKSRIAATQHNMGNAYFAQQQYDKAVEAYKYALKNNPKDDDTRYNLVRAMQMLQQQQQQQQEQKDQKDQKQEQKQQQQQQQNSKDQQDQKQDQQQQDQQDQQMDKETAEQLLQAIQQDEQDTQEKAKRAQMQGGKRVEKDW